MVRYCTVWYRTSARERRKSRNLPVENLDQERTFLEHHRAGQCVIPLVSTHEGESVLFPPPQHAVYHPSVSRFFGTLASALVRLLGKQCMEEPLGNTARRYC